MIKNLIVKYNSLKDRAARENIKREMNQRGLNPSSLARMMHKSPQFIWQVTKGLKPVGDELAVDFAEAFNYSDYLEIYRLDKTMAPEVVIKLWNRILDMHENNPEFIELAMELLETCNLLRDKSPELAQQFTDQIKSQLNFLTTLKK